VPIVRLQRGCTGFAHCAIQCDEASYADCSDNYSTEPSAQGTSLSVCQQIEDACL